MFEISVGKIGLENLKISKKWKENTFLYKNQN